MHSIAGGLSPHAAPHDKDERWLERVLETLWISYFADTPRVNDVRVSYGAAWKNRLGLITLSDDQTTSYIQINALLRRSNIPDCIARVTVAHELVHYAHGFGSPLPRRYRHPHRGGIVKRELVSRGMTSEYVEYEDWIDRNWFAFHVQYVGTDRTVAEVFGTNLVASSLPPD